MNAGKSWPERTRLRQALFGLLLVLPAAGVTAQPPDPVLSSLVRIHGTHQPGGGTVVALGGGVATVVTAAHVVAGSQRFEVVFAAAPEKRFAVDSASDLIGMQSDPDNGLAAFRVRGALPPGVAPAALETGTELRLGDREPLVLWGFPNRARNPRPMTGYFSGPDGFLLLVDRPVGEGASGGPLARGGRVFGVVTSSDEQFTYAVNARVVEIVLRGWGVGLRAGDKKPEVARQECRTGEEIEDQGIEFVRICGGTFTMGSAENDTRAHSDEKPAHQVTVSEFWIGKYEIANEHHQPSWPREQAGEPALPATGVSWGEANAACNDFGFRLPTEAEWEYAARAGSETAWSFGDEEGLIGHYAWHAGNSGLKVHPVGAREPNPWGLYDMHGNVWEWVADLDSPYSREPQIDPTGPPAEASSAPRILRGGSACPLGQAPTIKG